MLQDLFAASAKIDLKLLCRLKVHLI